MILMSECIFCIIFQSTKVIHRALLLVGVFNASFRTKGNISLNDSMLKGPSLTPNILKVQLRMPLKKYLMTADVSKAFLRVLYVVMIGALLVSL